MHKAHAIKAGCSGEKITTAAFLLRLVAVGERRGDEAADLLGHAARKFRGQENINMHRHVMAVLLHRTEGNENRNIPRIDASLVVRPWQFCCKNGVLGHLVLMS